MATKSAPRLITAAMAARVTAAQSAVRAATRVDIHALDWWQGVADARQGLSDALSAQADAMQQVLIKRSLRTGVYGEEPEQALITIVRHAAYDAARAADTAQTKQAEVEAGRARWQELAFATYADNIAAVA